MDAIRRDRLGWLVVGLLAACDEPGTPDPLERDDEPTHESSPAELEPSPNLTAAAAPREQVTGFSLDIDEDGDDLVLSWSEAGEAATYEVWTSSDPYFAPEDDGAVRLAEGIAGASWVHLGGNDELTRYYRVRAEGQPQPSTTAGKLVIPLEPGYSKLGLCLLSDVDTAEELLADMASPVISAHAWDAELQSWRWTWAATPVGLPLPTGGVVAVHHDETTPVDPDTYAMVGRVPVHGDVRIELWPGDNLVTLLPSRRDLHLASEVLAAVEHATRIGRWDASTQTTHWYPDEPDFEVSPCMPLHVEVSEPSTWPPVGYRRVIGPEGGTIEAYDGAVRLDVPAGALTEDVELRITPYPYPVGELVVPTLAFEPHDIPFAVPVTLTRRYRAPTAAPGETDQFAALTRYSTDGTVTVLEAIDDVEAGTLTASLETFSYIDLRLPCDPTDPFSLAIQPSSVSVQAGQTTSVTAEVFDQNGVNMGVSTGPVVWSSGDATIADVTTVGPDPGNGQVQGVAPGQTDIDAELSTCRLFYDDVFGSVVRFDAWPLYDAASVSVPSCTELFAQGLCPDDGCTGGCSNGVCDTTAANVGATCETDPDACSIEACVDVAGTGDCQVVGSVNCDDGRACTADACDAAQGCLHWRVGDPCGCDSGANGCLLLSFTCGPFYALCAGLCYIQHNDCLNACGC